MIIPLLLSPLPPFKNPRALSQLCAVQCCQWEPIRNSQLIGIYKEIPVQINWWLFPLPIIPLPPFETASALSQFFTVQCHQWEPIWNSQLITIFGLLGFVWWCGTIIGNDCSSEVIGSFQETTAVVSTFVFLSFVGNFNSDNMGNKEFRDGFFSVKDGISLLKFPTVDEQSFFYTIWKVFQKLWNICQLLSTKPKSVWVIMKKDNVHPSSQEFYQKHPWKWLVILIL